MIKILIITNAIDLWIKKCTSQISDYTIKKTGSAVFIRNLLLDITITPMVNDSARGRRYHTIILEKPIPENIYKEILQPSVQNFINLI